jgi:serpin B
MDAANGELQKVLNGYDKSAVAPTCARGLEWTGGQCEAAPAADGRCPETARRAGERCIADPVVRPTSARLVAANALMLLGRSRIVAADYQALVRDKYGAEVFAGVGLDEVNAWVRNKTEGKISQMLAQLDPNAAAVLLNAVYFKAHWAAVFSKAATKPEAFYLTAAQRIDAPMMRHTSRYAMVARTGYRAIRLPYDVGALAMIIVLPDATEGLAAVTQDFNAAELSALTAALNTGPTKLVALAMPRFRTSYMANLKAVFTALGLRAAFDRRRADFSGMTGRPGSEGSLAIDEVVHRAVIDVMEEGTEAAAATAVVVRAAAAAGPSRPEQPEPFVVNHPFLYFIADRASGAVLFAGRILDPR